MEFIKKIPILEGWSNDKKYCVTDKNGTKYLLRISAIEHYDAKKLEFNMMKKVALLDIPMCQAIELGVCDEGVYSIQSWIEGKNAEEALSSCSDNEKYSYGIDAGRILRKIHTIKAPKNKEDWEVYFNRKMDNKIKKYNECPIKYKNGQAFIDYINNNRNLLKNRPQVYQHGDYHIGNFMIADDKRLYVIDFNRSDYGDAWEEFNRIVWCAQKAPSFASGMLDGYFENNIPILFWKLLALYISSNTLSSICWAVPFGQEQIDVMINQADEILHWYDGMKSVIPAWYSRADER